MSKSMMKRVSILEGKGQWLVSCPNHHIHRLDEVLKKLPLAGMVPPDKDYRMNGMPYGLKCPSCGEREML